jgi:hypothetical protein
MPFSYWSAVSSKLMFPTFAQHAIRVCFIHTGNPVERPVGKAQ